MNSRVWRITDKPHVYLFGAEEFLLQHMLSITVIRQTKVGWDKMYTEKKVV